MECLTCTTIRPFDRLVLDSTCCIGKNENEYFEPRLMNILDKLLEQVFEFHLQGNLSNFLYDMLMIGKPSYTFIDGKSGIYTIYSLSV